MRRFLALALSLALAFGPAGSRAVLAATPHSAALWHVATVSDPLKGTFAYCAVESVFDNGFSLAFARNRDLNTNLIVTFPDARLSDNTKFRMGVAVDNSAARAFVGFSANPHTLVIPLQHDRAMVTALQKGRLLELKGPEDSIKFALDGAGDALHQLQQCVEANLKTETVSAGGAPEARPVITEGPIAANSAPATSDLVNPLPLPTAPSAPAESAAAPSAPVIIAPEPHVQVAQVDQAAPEPAKPSEATIEQQDADAARAEAARLADRRAKAEADAKAAADKQAADQAEAARLQAEQQAKAKADAALAVAEAKAAADKQAADQAEVAREQAKQAEKTKADIAKATADAEAAHIAAMKAQAQQDAERQAADDAAAKAALAKLADAEAAKKAAAQQQAQEAVPAAPQAAPQPQAAPPIKQEASLGRLLGSAGVNSTARPSGIYTWKTAEITGTAHETLAKQPFLDAMLDNIDALEKACKGRFSASIGAPVQHGDVTYAEAATRCGNTTGVQLYYQKTGYFSAIDQESAPTARDGAVTLRQRLEAGLN